MSENPDASVWETPDANVTLTDIVGDVEPAPEAATGPIPVVPVTVPTATELEGETAPPSRSVVAVDAASRAGRTALQSTAVTALSSALGVAATYLHDGDLSHLDWKAFAMAAMVAAGTPVAAYLHKMLGK